jgi:hypothetical protein
LPVRGPMSSGLRCSMWSRLACVTCRNPRHAGDHGRARKCDQHDPSRRDESRLCCDTRRSVYSLKTDPRVVIVLRGRLVARNSGHVGFLSDEHLPGLGGCRDGAGWSLVPGCCGRSWQSCGKRLGGFLAERCAGFVLADTGLKRYGCDAALPPTPRGPMNWRRSHGDRQVVDRVRSRTLYGVVVFVGGSLASTCRVPRTP